MQRRWWRGVSAHPPARPSGAAGGSRRAPGQRATTRSARRGQGAGGGAARLGNAHACACTRLRERRAAVAAPAAPACTHPIISRGAGGRAARAQSARDCLRRTPRPAQRVPTGIRTTRGDAPARVMRTCTPGRGRAAAPGANSCRLGSCRGLSARMPLAAAARQGTPGHAAPRRGHKIPVPRRAPVAQTSRAPRRGQLRVGETSDGPRPQSGGAATFGWIFTLAHHLNRRPAG